MMQVADRIGSKPSEASGRSRDLRLVMVSEAFYPELPGGLLRFFRYGPLLRERGIDVHVFTVKRPHHKRDRLEANRIFIHRIPATHCRNREEERLFLLDEALQWQGLQGQCPTVFQVMAAAGLKGAWKLWKARLMGIATVYALTIVVDPPPGNLLLRWRSRIRSIVTLSPYKRVFALSLRMKELYVDRLGIRPRRIEVIPNGVDLRRFYPANPGEKKKERRVYGIPEDCKVVLCVGALVERKRIDVILEAWQEIVKRVPDAFLLIVGAQEKRPSHDTREMGEAFDQYNQRIRQLAEDGLVSASVRIENELESIEKVYRLADVFVLPSRLEGMPNVLLEAMASGLPSVVNGFEGIPRDGEEIGNEGEHFFRCDGGADEWSESLVSLLRAGDKRAGVGRAARQWMLDHHGIEQIVARLSLEYREVASGG